MAVAMASGYDPSVKEQVELAAITVPNKQKYCERLEYSLELDLRGGGYGRKIQFVQGLLERYDIVMWLDSDALIMQERQIPAMLGEAGLTIARDCNGFNSGSYIAASRPDVKGFLNHVELLSQRKFERHVWREQMAMGELFETFPIYREIVRVVPQRELNSFVSAEYSRYDARENYQPGDWIVHFPALPMRRRIELALEFAKDAL
jgi:hypothetical protein